ncbi:MAG: hypothetical protein E7546_00900 [Ruminococcaceae bacterium]|nr:hypothetical protein [Oscillospiraceae bacterium]
MNNKTKVFKKWIIITLCCALIVFMIPLLTESFRAEKAETVVIVLDPGHGGSDTGAVNYRDGLYEAELNLAIALACYDELQKYDGVEVYMTHTGIEYSEGTLSLNDRCRMARDVDADILISLHCNDSSSPIANGAEVYVSHSTYKQSYNQDSTELAICFLQQFRGMGMNIRGVKTRLSNGSRMYYHEDGSVEVGDYYAVIGDTIKSYGIPGILVEHAFVTGDAQFLNTDEKLKAFGISDARAIADYYGLKLGDGTSSSDREEAIVVTDEEIMAASVVTNGIVSLPLDTAAWTEDALREIKDNYEQLSRSAKSLVDQESISTIYKMLLDFECRKHPVRITTVEESDLSIDRIDGFIKGLDVPTSSLKGQNAASVLAELQIYVDTNYADINSVSVNDITMYITNANGEILDIGQQVTTGCTVFMVRGDAVLDRLDIVLVGDIDGDGKIDSYDQLQLDSYLSATPGAPSEFVFTEAQIEACDVDEDGRVTESDINSLVQLIVTAG